VSDYSIACATCNRPTLHRSAGGSGFLALVLIVLLCAILPPFRGFLLLFAPLLALCAVLVPPTAIRCQACGAINSREWFAYFVRAGLGLAVVGVIWTAARQGAGV